MPPIEADNQQRSEVSRNRGPRATAAKEGKAAAILVPAIWFAMVAGLLEGIVVLSLQSLQWMGWSQLIEPVDENILWAAPLTNLPIFFAGGMVLVLIARVFPAMPAAKVAVGLFGVLATYPILTIPGIFRERALLALAAGLGMVMLRVFSRSQSEGLHFLRRTFKPLLVLCLLAGLGGYAWAGLYERFQVSRLPAPPADAPNVLFIVLDTLRADRLGSYGYSRPTSPFLDRFARQAVQFDAAFATSSWTLPSHASMFTGKLPHQHGAVLFPVTLQMPTLAEVLAENGYASVGFVSNNSPLSKGFGLAKGFHRWDNLFFGPYHAAYAGFRTAYGKRVRKYLLRGYAVQPWLLRMGAPEVERRFLGWLDARPNRPFFAFLNFMETHALETHGGFGPPFKYAQRFSEQPHKIMPTDEPLFFPVRRYANLQEKFGLLSDGYDASLAYLDASLEQLFTQLTNRGLDRDLIVIITSDHGESLGDHGLEDHRTSLYREQIHVPLLILFKGRTPPGVRVSAPIGLERLPATILELAGIRSGAFPDNSLVGLWEADGTHPDTVAVAELSGGDWAGVQENWPIRQGWLKALVTENWHFIYKQNGEMELFDWRTDPREEKNLASDPEYQTLLTELRLRLEELTR